MGRRDFITLLTGMATMWPFAAIAQNQSFTIGPPANPAAKLRAQEKAAAEKRAKAKETKAECRRRAVNERLRLASEAPSYPHVKKNDRAAITQGDDR